MIDLIQPVRSGRRLLDEIEAMDPVYPGVACWWLGQSGFVLKSREAVVYIDPYLSEHLSRKYADTEKPHIRMTEAPIQGEAITHADIVVSTHKHSDHMDPGTVPAILASSQQAVYVLPRAHREHVRDRRPRLAPVERPSRRGLDDVLGGLVRVHVIYNIIILRRDLLQESPLR